MLTAKQLALAVVLPALILAGTPFAFSENIETELGDSTLPADGLPVTYTRLSIGNDGVIRYEDAEIALGDIHVRADEVVYDSEGKSFRASGNVQLNLETMRVLTDLVGLNQATGEMEAQNVIGGAEMLFFDAKRVAGVSAESKTMEISGANVYFAEPHWSSVSFSTNLISYDKEEDWLRLDSSVFRIAGVPVLPLPPLSTPRFERPPVRVWASSGSKSSTGVYFSTTTHLTVFDEYEPGILLDFYERSGPLVGPALAYDTRDEASTRWMFGDFQSGYINDTGTRNEDIYGNEIGGRRGFINWFHKQQLDKLEITASIHRWSDSEVMDDFRSQIYNENQNPDNFVELVIPDRAYYISAITRMHLNDYQSVQQRLPEIRFDMMPDEIGKTGIFQRFSASYASLVEESSDQYHLTQTNYHGDELKSSRADFYYGWDAPIKFGEVATLTPVAGVRTTFYGSTVPDRDDTYWRTLGQLGFDLQFLVTGTSGYQNKTWGIDGLRHVLRPVLQYRYMPGVDSQSSRIPQIDRDIYRDAPSILDLGENRAVDQIYDEHIFRFGLENLFQTRDEKYGSRDLAELNIYQDIRKTERPVDNRNWSDNFVVLNITPANWISFAFAHRMDVYDFKTKSFKSSVTFTDGDVWSATLGARFVANDDLAYYGCDTRARQYTIRADYRLNSYFQIYGDWRYDDEKNYFTDQYYGLRQRLGNSWAIEYYVRHERDTSDGCEVSVGISASLLAY